MDNPDLESKTEEFNSEITKLKFKLFYRFAKSTKATSKVNELFTNGETTGKEINDAVVNRSLISEDDYISEISSVETKLVESYKELYDSHKKYLVEDMFSGDDFGD